MEISYDELDRNILKQLEDNGAMKCVDIAQALEVEEQEINSRLYGSLQKKCYQDDKFYWSIMHGENTCLKKDFNEQEYYLALDNNGEHLKYYLYNLNDKILKTPHLLFIKPIISGSILSEKVIEMIMTFMKNKSIDLNSNDYFKNRNDDLKGIDLVGGCICFSIYYFVQGKKMILQEKDISMYSNIIKYARIMGWKADNNYSTSKNTQELLFILISKGHAELQPVYDTLFEEVEENHSINFNVKVKEIVNTHDCQKIQIPEEKESSNKKFVWVNKNYSKENSIIKDNPLSNDNETLSDLKILLNSLAINGFIDSSFLRGNNQVSLNLQNIQKELCFSSVEDLIEKLGFNVGVIKGNVEYDFSKDDVSDTEYDNVFEWEHETDFLNTQISGFSNRAYNRLMMYGVKTYKDLLGLNLEDFQSRRGVGVGVLEEVAKRISEIQLELSNNKDNEDKQCPSVEESSIDFSWSKFFKENEYFKSLFNVIIPTSIKKEEVLPHILLNSKIELINKNFIVELKEAFTTAVDYKEISINGLTKAGDIGSFFSTINPGDLIRIKLHGNVKSEILELIEEALKNYTLTIVIGKGSSARRVCVDLPPFTAVFITDNIEKIPSNINSSIDLIIEPKILDEDLFELEILDSALKNNLKLTKETLLFLMDYTKNKHINSTIKYLSDYLYLNSDPNNILALIEMKQILE